MINFKKYKILFLTFLFCGLFGFSNLAQASTKQEEQLALQNQLKEIEQQIAQYEKELAVTTKEKNTLSNKINQLKTQQSALLLQVKQTSLLIGDLDKKIVTTVGSINEKSQQVENLRQELSFLIRQINASDRNFFLSFFSRKSLMEIAEKENQYLKLLQSLNQILNQTKQVKQELEQVQTTYFNQQEEAERLLQIKSAQQVSLSKSLLEQADLLQVTKGQEKSYQEILSDTKKRAAEIHSRIYELFNTGKQIDFGEAVEIATWASKATGVRAAFLLAILTQESNLGKNVGTCNRAGDPPSRSWEKVMKPDRDQEPFKKITTELNLDINTTPVSCPMRNKDGSQVGWGGAMGPAQFIPSTWMAWKDKVSALTGKSPANPWDIRDAFLASALKLKSNGAGTVEGEWRAAMYYFAGGVNLKFRFYADNVVKIAQGYQEDIDTMQK